MRLLIFGDSLCYYGPDQAMPVDDPRLWPNRLGADAHVAAGIGWTMREAFWSLSGDPAVWAQLPRIDVVVIAVGGMDSLPSPLPTYLRQGIRYLRPAWLRRAARSGYLAVQPMLARLPGVPVALPPRLSAGYLRRIVRGLRGLRPDLPVLGTLPSTHRAASYGRCHPGHAAQRAVLADAYRELDVPVVDLHAVTGAHVLGGHGNPDGIHWGWPAHDDVAHAVQAALDGIHSRR